MKIILTRLALEDLDRAYEYIAANNPDAAIDTSGLKMREIDCSSTLRWEDWGR